MSGNPQGNFGNRNGGEFATQPRRNHELSFSHASSRREFLGMPDTEVALPREGVMNDTAKLTLHASNACKVAKDDEKTLS